MNDLYERLDSTNEREDRRKIISDYLKSKDLTDILLEGHELSEKTSILSKEGISFSSPFIVGDQYLEDDAHQHEVDCLFYVLAIVKTPNSEELLTINNNSWDGEPLRCLPRSDVVPYEEMNRKFY